VILSRNDPLSFSIFNRGLDQEEFAVQDLSTLNSWIRALQQHIVDIRMYYSPLFLFFVSFICDLGSWEQTHENVPSVRRYSYQPLTTSSSTSDLTPKSILKTKARSLGMCNIRKLNKNLFSNFR
jgi:hypothetical protein